MITLTVKHEDYNDREVESTFHFHLNKRRMLELKSLFGDDLDNRVRSMVHDEDALGLIEMLEQLLVAAVGKKSDDGQSFVQNEEIREWFRGHSGFEACLERVVESSDSAQAFVQGIVPKDVRMHLESEAQPPLV